MSNETISLAVLAIIFLIATVRGVNMGALALVASFIVGLVVYDVTTDDVLAGFPSGLFVILVGVTYLFALAKNNGTVDWIVHGSVRAVGGRVDRRQRRFQSGGQAHERIVPTGAQHRVARGIDR